MDDVVGTGLLTEPATVTGRRINPHQTIVSPFDGALGTHLDTRGVLAMLAEHRQVRHPDPGCLTSLDPDHVDPEMAGVGLRCRPRRIAVPDMFVLAGDDAQAATAALVDIDQK